MCLVFRGLVWLVLASGLLGSEANFWELRHLSASLAVGLSRVTSATDSLKLL